MVLFRRSISELVRGIRKIDKSGITTSPASREQPEPQEQKSFEDVMDAGTSGVLKEKEKLVRENLARVATKSDEERIRLLVRSLAASYLAAEFNQISRAIFQGQIELLVKLNSLPNGIPDKEVRDYYDALRKRTGPFYDGFTFEQFIEFLTKNGLVFHRDGRWLISSYGDEFLKHLVATHQTYERKG